MTRERGDEGPAVGDPRALSGSVLKECDVVPLSKPGRMLVRGDVDRGETGADDVIEMEDGDRAGFENAVVMGEWDREGIGGRR
jgi:hypothetical protein